MATMLLMKKLHTSFLVLTTNIHKLDKWYMNVRAPFHNTTTLNGYHMSKQNDSLLHF